jgi:molecular chaperone DnaK (HSP70)
MPRLPINYENACIYEIVCKDVSITQRYIGSTTNLINRRNHHRSSCNNEKCNNYNQYVYQFIRDNGGIANWDIVLVEKVIDCKDKEHLHKRERFYIEEKKAELNKQIPLRTVKEWYQDNKEHHKEYRKIYYEENKEKLAEYRKIYYEENKEKCNEYYENNVDKLKEYQKAYHKAYYANKKNLN